MDNLIISKNNLDNKIMAMEKDTREKNKENKEKQKDLLKIVAD